MKAAAQLARRRTPSTLRSWSRRARGTAWAAFPYSRGLLLSVSSAPSSLWQDLPSMYAPVADLLAYMVQCSDQSICSRCSRTACNAWQLHSFLGPRKACRRLHEHHWAFAWVLLHCMPIAALLTHCNVQYHLACMRRVCNLLMYMATSSI